MLEMAAPKNTGVVRPARNASWSCVAPATRSSSSSSTAWYQSVPSSAAARSAVIASSTASWAPPRARV